MYLKKKFLSSANLFNESLKYGSISQYHQNRKCPQYHVLEPYYVLFYTTIPFVHQIDSLLFLGPWLYDVFQAPLHFSMVKRLDFDQAPKSKDVFSGSFPAVSQIQRTLKPQGKRESQNGRLNHHTKEGNLPNKYIYLFYLFIRQTLFRTHYVSDSLEGIIKIVTKQINLVTKIDKILMVREPAIQASTHLTAINSHFSQRVSELFLSLPRGQLFKHLWP